MLGLILALVAGQARPATFDLTILHTNDLHGHICPFAYTEVGRRKTELPSVGGAARRATLIRRLKAQIHHPVILVDSGDTFTRGPLTNAYEGLADTEAMNAVDYDLAAIGNNEFKAKDAREQNDAAGAQAALLRVIKRSHFTWLCANAKNEKGTFLEGVQPYVVREMGGVRVGFLGLTAPRSASYPQVKGWTISNQNAAAREWIPKARADCDVLIAITHIGTPFDMLLAAGTSGLDAIVGGDSHTFLYKAVEVKNRDGERVPIVQDGEFGVNLGRFDLHFTRGPDGKYRLASYKYELLPVSADIPEAPDVLAAIEPYVRPMREVVGHIAEVGETPQARQANTAKVFATAMMTAAKADVGLCKTDGFFDVFRSKAVTRYDIWAAVPFKDDVATTTIDGARLREILQQKNVAFSGLAARDAAAAGRSYRVACIDFDAPSAFKIPANQTTGTGIDVREAVVAFLKGTVPK